MDFILGTIIALAMYGVLILLTLWVMSLIWSTYVEDGDYRVWVTYKQFKHLFNKYSHEFKQDGLGLEGENHDLDLGTVKINGVLLYFYTPIDFLMYDLYLLRYTRERKASKTFTTYDKIKDIL